MGAVRELAREVDAARRGPFPHNLLLRGAARLARARREDDARHDRFGDGLVVVHPVLESGPHHAVHGREHRLRLNAEPLREASMWLEHYRTFWDSRLAALEAFLLKKEPGAGSEQAEHPREDGR